MNPLYSKQQESYSKKEESTQNTMESMFKEVHVQFFVPQSVVGVIIGKGGSMIKKIEEQFDVKLFIDNIGEAQTLIGMYGPEDGIQNATETIMKLLLSLRAIQTKLDEMGKPRTLRYVEEMTFLSLPVAGQPAWFVNLNEERIQLENCDKKIPKETETAKTDMTESHSEEISRGLPMLISPVPPIKPEKSKKSKSEAPPCLFKVKIVPKTLSGLPNDRFETEAIALFIRTPVNYGLMVGTLRAGVENLPENFNLSMKIDNEWMKIPRPKNNENDAEIWDEYFVNQPKASRVLYLVEMPKMNKTKPDDENSETKPEQENPKTEAEIQTLAEKTKSLELELAKEKSKNVHQSKENEEQKRELVKLRSQQKDVKEKPDRAGSYPDLDRKMKMKTNGSQALKCNASGSVTPSKSTINWQHLRTPFLIVNPTACTVPAAGGEVTFKLFNSGLKRLVFRTICPNACGYKVNPAYAFIEAGATSRIQLNGKDEIPKVGKLYIVSANVSPKSTNAETAFHAATIYAFIAIPVSATADNTVTTLTTSSETPITDSSNFRNSGTVDDFFRPTLIVTPTACTVPAAGGEVTFQLFNPGPQRLVYDLYASNYPMSPASAFIEAGATTSRQLTCKAGPFREIELFIHFTSASPDAADAETALKAATRFQCIKIPVSVTI